MSVLSLVTHLPKSKTFEKREVSSANILQIKVIPSGRSFKNSEIKMILIQILVELQN